MKRALTIISFALYGFYAVMVPFFAIYLRMSEASYYIALYMTMGLGTLQILLLLAWVMNKLEMKRITAAVHVSYVALACVFYYVLEYAKGYDSHVWLYWGIFYGVGILMTVVLTIINYRLKPQRAVMFPKKK